VLFADVRLGFIFSGEQFWGRAARAPVTRKSPGARYFSRFFGHRQAGIKKRRVMRRFFFLKIASVCADREVDRNPGLCFDGHAILQVRFEAPLLDRFARRIR